MIENVLKVINKWLYVEDETQIKIMLAVAVASQCPGEPIWMFVIGPSGSSKTEILRSLRTSSRIYSIDSVTARSFISGFGSASSGEFDLLPELNGKLFVIKDFSILLETGTQKDRDSVFTILRQVYDGYYEVKFGSLKGKKSYTSRFGILTGVTDVIDYYSKVHSMLGERFIKLRVKYNRREFVRSAFRHSGNEDKMREEIAEAVRIALDWYSTLAPVPVLKPETEEKILNLSECVAILRSPVPRDYKHEVSYLLSPEIATRLGKQFLRLAQALFRIDSWNYNYLLRVARDSVFPERLRIVDYLRNHSKDSITNIADFTKQPRNVIKYGCEDLWFLGVCDRRLDSSSYFYSLKSDFISSLESAGL